MAYQIEGITYGHDTLKQIVGDAIDAKFRRPQTGFRSSTP
jgi:hypothetical protein